MKTQVVVPARRPRPPHACIAFGDFSVATTMTSSLTHPEQGGVSGAGRGYACIHRSVSSEQVQNVREEERNLISYILIMVSFVNILVTILAAFL